MTVLNILLYPDPILRKVSEPVHTLIQPVHTLIEDMKETMVACGNAIGLSAIQVGQSLRIIIVDKGNGNLVRYVNPVIESATGSFSVQEGCLSFPKITDGLLRHKVVTFKHSVFKGEAMVGEATETVSDLLAVVIQHEIDHLNGVLMVDHMSQVYRKKVDKMFKVKT